MSESVTTGPWWKSSHVDVRVWVERMEFPLVAITGAYGENTFHSCTLQMMVPQDPDFLPRVLVEVEYLDTRDYPQGVAHFEGELDSYVYIETAQGNYCVMQCLGLMSYQAVTRLPSAIAGGMDDAQEEADEILDEGGGIATAGNAMSSFTGAQIIRTGMDLLDVLTTRPLTGNLQGILGGLVHLYEHCMGLEQAGKATAAKTGRGDLFLQLANARLNLLQQITALEEDTTPEMLLDLRSSRSWFKRVIESARVSASPTFMQVKGLLLQRVFYRSISMGPTLMSGSRQIQEEVHSSLPAIAELGARIRAVLKFIEKCAHDQYPLFLLGGDSLSVRFMKADAAVRVAAPGGVIPVPWSRAVEKLAQAAQMLGARIDPVITTSSSDVPGAEGTSLSPVPGIMNSELMQLLALYAELLEDVLVLLRGLGLGSTHMERSTSPGGWHGEVLLPELFFDVPPACNAIWPDMHESLQVSRPLLQEPTRLILVGPVVGEPGLYFQKQGQIFVVAPNLSGLTGGRILEDVLRGKYTLLPHEKWGGPVPVVLPVTQALGLDEADLSGGGQYEDPEDDESSGGQYMQKMESLPGHKKFAFLQKVAHFEYMNRLLSTRTGSLSGRYWPRIIPGLPCGIKAQSGQVWTGKVVNIHYSIDGQRNTHMTLSLSHMLETKGRESVVVHRRFYTPDGDFANDAAQALNEARSGRLSENWGKMSSGATAAAKYAASLKSDSGKAARLEKKIAVLDNLVNHVQAPSTGISETSTGSLGNDPSFDPMVSNPQAHNMVSPEAADLDGWGSEIQKAVEDVLNDLGGGTAQTTHSSMEFDKVVWPGWLPPMYDPPRVGKEVYKPLFGVLSMYDFLPALPAGSVHGDRSVGEIVHDFMALYTNVSEDTVRRPLETIARWMAFVPGASWDGVDAGPGDPRIERYAQLASLRAQLQYLNPFSHVLTASRVEQYTPSGAGIESKIASTIPKIP